MNEKGFVRKESLEKPWSRLELLRESSDFLMKQIQSLRRVHVHKVFSDICSRATVPSSHSKYFSAVKSLCLESTQ
jgi:hypothetical protein